MLARREHSRAELARKLAPDAESAALLEALLDELQAKRQLCDVRYAEQRAHILARKYGAARIRQDLKAKGVGEEIAQRVLGEGDLEKARAILARKYPKPAVTQQERAQRARFLQGRGFSFDVIRQALRLSSDDTV